VSAIWLESGQACLSVHCWKLAHAARYR
jgi:hypothetical protein